MYNVWGSILDNKMGSEVTKAENVSIFTIRSAALTRNTVPSEKGFAVRLSVSSTCSFFVFIIV